MKNSQDDFCVCPSFNSYSSNRSVEIALRVAGNSTSDTAGSGYSGGNDDDFEFAFVRVDKEASVGDFIYDGPVFPVFNRDWIEKGGGSEQPEPNTLIPLSKLFAEEDDERGSPPSCSSSEADELDNNLSETYCARRPPPLPSQCEKSKSTGSASRRWKFRNLLRRSKSDGKESLVFVTPKQREEKSEKLTAASPKKGKGSDWAASAHEAFYVQNRAMKEGDKRKSYLPYRRELVGVFANVSGVRRSFSHL